MNLKKVLFVHHSGWVGGSAVSMLQLASALKNSSFQPRVVFSSHGPVLEFARKWDVPTEVVNMKSVFFYSSIVPPKLRHLAAYIVHYRSTGKAIRTMIAQERPDIVHLNTSVLIPAARQINKLDVPIVWHVRDPLGPNTTLNRWQVKQVRSLASHIITNSHYVAHQYRGPTPISVIHNAVDKRSFSPKSDDARSRIRRSLGLPSEAPVVGLIGGVSVQKGHYFLLEAATHLVKVVPNVQFLIIAGGLGAEYSSSIRGKMKRLVGAPLDNFENLQRQIKKRGLTNSFTFTGFRSDISEMITAMDVLSFLPTIPEGFGRPLIEGMAMACPIVATDLGPTSEIVGTGTAKLVPPGDVEGLASALASILVDDPLSKTMGETGRMRFLENFEMQQMVRKVTDVYDQVL